MKKYLIALAFVAATQATAGEFVPAAGFGSQYGDLGAKFMYREGTMAAYAGVGVGGGALGFHLAHSAGSPHVFGMQYGFSSDVFDGKDMLLGTYDYHFSGFSGRGWTLGAGLGVADYDDGRRDGDSRTLAVLNVGYKF
ncbi:hypothetical protein [Rheinheimera sp.]|uniref:hypothetical protein n=1 Tax=Rheinheimera sp. TaxID=1869214 RepID=UPI00307FC80F